jgi:hypothetical protein
VSRIAFRSFFETSVLDPFTDFISSLCCKEDENEGKAMAISLLYKFVNTYSSLE